MDRAPETQTARALRLAALAVLVLLGWIIARPYLGITNDALHYTALALYRLDPASMAHDVLFLNGHATYSLFPLVQTALVGALGPGAAHMAALVVGHALWLAGLVWVARRLFGVGPGGPVLVAGAVLAALWLGRGYGAEGALIYGEMIVTPRLFAEALMLLSLGAALAARRAVAGLIGLLALAVHPLMAGPALLVILGSLFGLWRGVWLPMAAGGALAFVLALAGIAPFAGLLSRFDADWLAVVDDLFLSNALLKSGPADAAFYALPLVALVLAARGPHAGMARLARAVLAVTGAFCALGLAGEVLDNVLIVNLHLWRALWLLMVLGNLFAVPVLVLCMGAGLARQVLGLALIVGLFDPLFVHFPIATAVLAALALFVHLVGPRVPKGANAAFHAVVWLGVALAFALFLTVALLRYGDAFQDGRLTHAAWVPIVRALLLAALAVLASLRRAQAVMAAAVLLAGAALILPGWDLRPTARKLVEQGAGASAQVAGLITGRNVYWQGGPEVPWFVYGTASYYSCVQSAAILSSRANALDFDARGQVLRRLNTPDFPAERPGYCHQRADPAALAPDVADLRAVCQGLPDLDIVALKAPVPGAPPPAAVVTPGADLTAHLYECADFRALPGQEG